MKFLSILHASYEETGLIDEWISLQNHSIQKTFAWDITSLEAPESFDALIIMGGPMSVNDEEKLPWLKEEKAFIKRVIKGEKKILGICLGSQLLADCLGARVYRNEEKEIGWFQVKKRFLMHSWFPLFDDREKEYVFHWHGETYDLPSGSLPLFESEGCKNQAFAVEDRILGLQFHPEITPGLIHDFIEHGRPEIVPGRYIQSEARMISNYSLYGESSKTLLSDLLDDFFSV